MCLVFQSLQSSLILSEVPCECYLWCLRSLQSGESGRLLHLPWLFRSFARSVLPTCKDSISVLRGKVDVTPDDLIISAYSSKMPPLTSLLFGASAVSIFCNQTLLLRWPPFFQLFLSRSTPGEDYACEGGAWTWHTKNQEMVTVLRLCWILLTTCVPFYRNSLECLL